MGIIGVCVELGGGDSWVPNVGQLQYGCLKSGNADVAACTADFTDKSGGKECMGTFAIFDDKTKYADKASVFTALGTRYTSAGCAQFNLDFSNIWGNYYLIKRKIKQT